MKSKWKTGILLSGLAGTYLLGTLAGALHNYEYKKVINKEIDEHNEQIERIHGKQYQLKLDKEEQKAEQITLLNDGIIKKQEFYRNRNSID